VIARRRAATTLSRRARVEERAVSRDLPSRMGTIGKENQIAIDQRWGGSSGGNAASETSSWSLGPYLLRNHFDLADRGRAYVWRGAGPLSRSCGSYSPRRDGGDDRHGCQFWPHGDGLSICWICLHLCKSRV